jgi:hypothetical protein
MGLNNFFANFFCAWNKYSSLQEISASYCVYSARWHVTLDNSSVAREFQSESKGLHEVSSEAKRFVDCKRFRNAAVGFQIHFSILTNGLRFTKT